MEKSVILIGMPGRGKTTIGRILSRELDLELQDTDAEVVEMSGMSIPDIFSSSGEERFRELETEALKKVLGKAPCIISCGGGVILREENRKLLKKGVTVFIERPLSKLAKRGRPISLTREINDIYAERIDIYRACADITVKNDGPKKAVAEMIIKKLK